MPEKATNKQTNKQTKKQTNKQTKKFLILAFSKTINKTVIQYNQCVTQLKYWNLIKYILVNSHVKDSVNSHVSYTFNFNFIFTLNLTLYKFNSFVEYDISCHFIYQIFIQKM